MNKLTEIDNNWPKKITVDKRIVGLLSASTYTNFPRALKELITNSYDADALHVKINIDLSKEQMIVFDDGKGMSEEEFSFYIRIAGKTRKKEDSRTKLGRNIIGQFGVGFLAVFPFFKSYKIESKKAGSNKVLFATVPLHKYFSEGNDPIDIGSISIDGGEIEIKEDFGRSYTRITLTGFNDITNGYFFDDPDVKYNSRDVNTYSGIDRLKWVLSDDLPLKFKEAKFNSLFTYPEVEKFHVYVNGEELFRQVYADTILETQEGEYLEVGKIKSKYFIATSGKSVFPYSARFFKLRNLNVGVGKDRDSFGESNRSRIHWLTGEIHIIDGLNDMINLSRDGFNYNNDFEELKDILRKRLVHYSNRLEQEAELNKELRQTGDSFKISDVSLLDPEKIQSKVQDLKNKGIVKLSSKESNKHVSEDPNLDVPVGSNIPKIDDKAHQESVEKFQKKIIISNRKFLVRSESWDYENALFKACRIENDIITINTNYPLFSGKKYTDVFIKMSLLLTFRYLSGDISEELFVNLNHDIFNFFREYI